VEVALKSSTGSDAGTVELADDVFGITPNVSVMHQVIVAQLAHRRAGTQSTKTRAEVRGGGRKPFKQKGTGNARQGSNRAPHFSGGGIALGPKPRNYSQRTPKKMIRLALRSALSDRASEGKVVVVDSWGIDAPKTKDAVAALQAIGAEGRVLVVVTREQEAVAKSFRNLTDIHVIEFGELNAYDVLCNDWIVFSRDSLPAGLGSAEVRPAAAAKAATPAAATKAEAAPEPEPEPEEEAEPDEAAGDEGVDEA
jgi:large subunit ribosomal protein L4